MFKDPLTLHIAIEIVLFIAIIFWISSTNKRVAFHIKSLAERLNEQEERILELEARAAASAGVRVVNIAPSVSQVKKEAVKRATSPTPNIEERENEEEEEEEEEDEQEQE